MFDAKNYCGKCQRLWKRCECNIVIPPVVGVPATSGSGLNLELNLKIEVKDGVAKVVSMTQQPLPLKQVEAHQCECGDCDLK